MTSTNAGAPSLAPPNAASSTETESPGMSKPALTDTDLAAMTQASAPMPMLTPAAEVAGAVTAEGITATWRTNVQITALWSIDETRNAWAHVAGLGWRKIYNGRDGAFQALVSLASQARQTNRPVSVREESDGMIYEIYLW